MKMTIESTTKIVEVNGVPARVWQGTTERGVPIVALITSVAVERDQDQTEFDADLQEHAPPTAYADAFPDLMFIDHAREVEQP